MNQAQNGSPLTDAEKSMRELSIGFINTVLTSNRQITELFPDDHNAGICDMIANYARFIQANKDLLYINHSFAQSQMDSFFAIISEILEKVDKLIAKEIAPADLIALYRQNNSEITRVSSHFNAENLAEYFYGKNEVINIMKSSKTIDDKSLKQYLDKRKDSKIVIKSLITRRQISDVDQLLVNLESMHTIAVTFLENTNNYTDEIKNQIEFIFNDMIRKTIRVRAFFILETFNSDLTTEIIGNPAEAILKIKQQVDIPESIYAIFQNAHTNEDIQTISDEFRNKLNYTMSYRILDIYFEMVRLCFLANRIEILLTNSLSGADMREYYSALTLFIITYFDPKNINITSSQIHQYQTQIRNLIKMTDSVNFGSHTTKAFARREIIKACLEKLDLLYDTIDQTFAFITHINKIIKEPIKPTLPIIMAPVIGNISLARFGYKNLENLEPSVAEILNRFLTNLPTEGVKDEIGNGYHMGEKDLIVPNLHAEFSFLMEEMKKPYFTKLFSNNFFFNLNAILHGPNSLTIFNKCMRECSRIFLMTEFFGQQQPREIFDALMKIANSYNWIATLDFLGVIDYTAAVHLMYVRTYSHLCFREDVMANAKLFDKIEQFTAVIEKIEQFHSFFERDTYKEVIKNIFGQTVPAIDKLLSLNQKEEIEKFNNVIEWILCANIGVVKYLDQESVSLEGFDILKDAISYLNNRSQDEERMSKSMKYLSNFFNIEKSRKYDTEEILNHLNVLLELLTKEGIIFSDITNVNLENFNDFKDLFIFRNDIIFGELESEVRNLLSVTKKEGENMYKCMDRLIRGSFCIETIHELLTEVCILSSQFEADFSHVKKTLKNLTLTLIFMGIIDVISSNNSLQSVLKVFNYRQFMNFFVNEILYINTAGVFSPADSQLVLKESLAIKRFAQDELTNATEDFSKAKASFIRISSVIQKTDDSFFIKKARNILVTATTILEEGENSETLALYDRLTSEFTQENFVELFEKLPEKLKSSNVYPFLVQIVSILNTRNIYASLIRDSNSFLSSFQLKTFSITLIDPFVIIPDFAAVSRGVRPPTLPLQASIEYSNDDYVNFCISSQKEAVENILSQSEVFTQESDIKAPSEVLSVDIQNDIAQALIDEKTAHNHLNDANLGDMPNSSGIRELQSLQDKVIEEERRQNSLRKQLRESVNKWRKELQNLSSLYDKCVDEVSDLRSDCMEYCGLEARQKAVQARVDRKREAVLLLKQQLSSLLVGDEITCLLGQESRAFAESLGDMAGNYVINADDSAQEISKHLASLSPYEIPEQKIEKTGEKDEVSPETPSKQSKVPPIIAKYCHTPGLFPAATREAVEAHVDELSRIGDSRELVKKFSDINARGLAEKMKRNTRIVTANIIEKQADLSRRISILNEILNDGDN